MASRMMTEGSSFAVIEMYVSPEGDSNSIKSIERFSNDRLYPYETIQFYNEMIYNFYINSINPNDLPQDITNEINFIFNSYKIIS
jgi:hypothetical protein